MYCLLELVAVAPETLAPQFVDQLDWIQVWCLNVFVG